MKVKLLIVLGFALFVTTLFAQEQKTGQLAEMSLEDLLNMDVSTDSKLDAKQSDTPGILSVLSKGKLDRFGSTTGDGIPSIPGRAIYFGLSAAL